MPILSPTYAPLRKKLEDPNTVGTVLLIILVDSWGTEFFDWEPETLRRQAVADFGATIPPENLDKIWALVTYMTTDRVWNDLDLFVHTANALSDQGSDFENYDPADVQEIAWALSELMLLEPPAEGEEPSPDILVYIEAKLAEEGFTKPPRVLAKYVSEPPSEESIGETLEADAIDIKSHWDRQTEKRVEVDTFIRNRLHELLQDVAQLPLRNADDQARKALLERAGKALEVQSKETAQEQELSPQQPAL